MTARHLAEILTVSEVAEYLRIPRKTVYTMLRSGRLRAFKAGRHWRVTRVDLDAFIASATAKNGGKSA